MQAVFFRQVDDLFPRLLLLQEAHFVRLDAEDDVVEDGEAFDQLEVLVDHADAERVGVVRVADLDLAAVLVDLAFLRLVKAEEDAHERRFACAVFTEQGVDLTLFELQGDVVVGDDTGETFCDVEHLDRVLRFQVFSPSFRFYGPRLRGRKPFYPLYYICADKAKSFSVFPVFLEKRTKKVCRPEPAHFLNVPYFRLPKSSTVTLVTAGIAVMSLETVTSPANMAATSAS